MSEEIFCTICHGKASRVRHNSPVRDKINCAICGNISLTPAQFARLQADRFTLRQAANARGFLQENPDFRKNITEAQVDFLRELSTPSVVEKAHKLLRFLAKHFPEPGNVIKLPRLESLFTNALSGPGSFSFAEMFRACWASENEVEYLIFEVLHKELGLIAVERYNMQSDPLCHGMITPKGWVALDTMAKIEVLGECFVAMWFHKEMEPLFLKAIHPGAKLAGYDAVRVDKIEHLNKIDDEILAGIRRGQFLIVDFTGQRGGVYFEAGFAMGLGKQVIWLVREDKLKKTHFDNRQYNFITWTADKLPELRDKIRFRIESNFGIGPRLRGTPES